MVSAGANMAFSITVDLYSGFEKYSRQMSVPASGFLLQICKFLVLKNLN